MFAKANTLARNNAAPIERDNRVATSTLTSRPTSSNSTYPGLALNEAPVVASEATGAQVLVQPDTGNESANRLVVGPNVKLKGAEILDCDTLVVEGRVEATMDSRVLRIAEQGAFTGKVSIDIAEIHGHFEGELTVRQQLIVHATGRVSGSVRYGKILVAEGGELSGDVCTLAAQTTTRLEGPKRNDSLGKGIVAVNSKAA
ncbi:bactofilin family protein [Chitinimonas sp. PSY-7]|uniref:polymer-forming cytoskeletal protein n=1 Tax=Chitinimonas sp. PSY-7 TaxID=3459088 RepID=UPI00403FE990